MTSSQTPIDTLDPISLVETILTVPTKQGTVEPFKMLPIQQDRVNRKSKKIVGLKGRQMGYSSIGLAIRSVKGMTIPNRNTLFVLHDEQSTALFRARIKHHYDDFKRAGMAPMIGIDNEQEMYFSLLNSRFLFETAGGRGVGRSFTVHDLHGSEVAHWPYADKVLAGLLQSIPLGADIELESTPAGSAGPFYELCRETYANKEVFGGAWDLCFYPWWLDLEYTLGDVTPIKSLTDHEQYLMREYGLTHGQIAWRRMKEAELSLSGTPFEQEFPEDPITCFLSGEGKVFQLPVIRRLRSGIRQPIKETPVAYGSGVIKYYELPRVGHTYTVALDPSEGSHSKKSDPSGIQVLDNQEMKQVCSVQAKLSPSDAARLTAKLGHEYNDALIIPERNGVGRAALNTLIDELDYSEIYYEQDVDSTPGSESYRPGWTTTTKTRPDLIDDFIEAVMSGALVMYDEATINEVVNLEWEELKTRNSRGRMLKALAPEGGHDDLAMSIALTIQGRKQAPLPGGRAEPQEEVWDMPTERLRVAI